MLWFFSMSNDLLCSWEFSFTNFPYVHSETKILKTVLVNQVLADISHQVWIFRKLRQKIKNSRACNITELASSVDLKNNLLFVASKELVLVWITRTLVCCLTELEGTQILLPFLESFMRCWNISGLDTKDLCTFYIPISFR